MASFTDGKSCFPIYKDLDGHQGLYVSRRFVSSVSTGDEVVDASIDIVREWVNALALKCNGKKPELSRDKENGNKSIVEVWY